MAGLSIGTRKPNHGSMVLRGKKLRKVGLRSILEGRRERRKRCHLSSPGVRETTALKRGDRGGGARGRGVEEDSVRSGLGRVDWIIRLGDLGIQDSVPCDVLFMNGRCHVHYT